jgi:tetratricopeptide (TPR) repeat protein
MSARALLLSCVLGVACAGAPVSRDAEAPAPASDEAPPVEAEPEPEATAPPGPVALPEGITPAEDPRAALLAGVAAREGGAWGEAIALFRSALAAAPTWSAAHLELAEALLMTGGDPGEIGQHLQHVRLLDRDSPRLHYLEGLLMEERREPAMAAAAYERAVEVRPSLFDARIRLGRLLLDEGHVDEAIVHLEAAVRIDPSNLPARANLARAYEDAGRVEEAERQLQQVAALFPDNPFHIQRLAAFYERHGREREAREAMRRAEAIEPGRQQQRMRPLPPSRR